MNIKHIATLLLMLFVLTFPLLASGEKEQQGGQMEAGEQLVDEIGVMTQPNPVFATVSVALEKGWFKEAGFDTVNVLSFTSGNAAGEALVAGELTVWLPGNVPVISMRHNGLPVVITGDLNVAYAEHLVIRDDAGVESPEDLYDIKIGLLQGSTASAIIGGLAEDYGLDQSRLNLVNLAPPEQVTALRNNEVQGIAVWPPHVFNVSDIATPRFDATQYSHTHVPIVFNESFVRNNTASARAITEVLYRAKDFVMENPEEAKRIHAERTEQPMDLLNQMYPVWWRDDLNHGYIDRNFVDDYNAYTEFLKGQGAISGDTINVLDYTYSGFVNEINPDYVKIEGRWQP